MNSNRLMAFFLVLAMAMPSTLQAHMSISFETLKASWFQAVDLIKNNNGAKVIASVAVVTTGLSGFLGYQLWRSNQINKVLNEEQKGLKQEIKTLSEKPVQIAQENKIESNSEKDKTIEAIKENFKNENDALKKEIRRFFVDKFPIICDLIAKDVDREVGPEVELMAKEFPILSILSDHQTRLINMINIARGNALIVYPLIDTAQKGCDSIPVIKPDFSNLGAWAKKRKDWGPLTVPAEYATHEKNFSYDEALKTWQELSSGNKKVN